jgi:hypothetical protein
LTVSGKISGGVTIVARPGSGVAVGTGDGTIVAVAVAVGLNAETVNPLHPLMEDITNPIIITVRKRFINLPIQLPGKINKSYSAGGYIIIAT